MPGNDDRRAVTYVLDTSSISLAWLAYYRDIFPGFWNLFDALARGGVVTSVRAVREEQTNRRVDGAIAYLENLNGRFFAEPTDAGQALVMDMARNPGLSAAANRWRAKANDDADPYLIAKVMGALAPSAVVTEESQDPVRTASIYSVCGYLGVDCVNLQQMMRRLGWQF